MVDLNPKTCFDSMSIGVQIISPQMEYIFLNRKLLSEINKNPEEIIGQSMAQTFPGIEKSEIYQAIQKCFASKQGAKIINEFTLPNGVTAYYQLNLEYIGDAVIIFSQDVSQDKKPEILLEETKENRDLKKFKRVRTESRGKIS